MPSVPAIPPVVVLVVFLVLIGTHVAYVVAPAKAGYPVRLLVSALAVGVGEAAAALGLGAALALGELHPYQDLALLAIGQWAVGLTMPPPR